MMYRNFFGGFNWPRNEDEIKAEYKKYTYTLYSEEQATGRSFTVAKGMSRGEATSARRIAERQDTYGRYAYHVEQD